MFPERPGPVLSRALMQKSPGGVAGPPEPNAGPGGNLAPAHRHPGGCAPGHPGPCKRSDPQMVGTFLLQVAALKPPVSAGHGQRWEGQDGAETGGGGSSRASQPPREPLLGSLSPSLVRGPSGMRGPSAPTHEWVTTCHTSEVTLPGNGEGRPENRVSCQQKP